MSRVTIPDKGEVSPAGFHDKKESYDKRNAKNNPCPSQDRSVLHPGMVFGDGQWRSPKAYREKLARANAKKNPRRVRDGQYYIGLAPRPEQAATLNEDLRRFRARQKQSRA